MSKRFGRRRRRDMRSRIVALERECANLRRSNDVFIREHRVTLQAIDIVLDDEQARQLRLCIMNLSTKKNIE